MTTTPESASQVNGTVQGALAGLVMQYCQEHQLTIPTVCHAYSPGERMPFSAWQQMLHAVAAQDLRPALGLAIAKRVQPAHVGLLAYLGLSCATLGDALLQLQRYHRLAYDGSTLYVRQVGTNIEISWGMEAGCPGQLVDETAVGLFYQIVSQLMHPHRLKLESLAFINAPPLRKQPYYDFFGCPVYFEAPRTSIVLSIAHLSTPLSRPDSALQAILDQQAGALLATLPRHDEFDRQLQGLLVEAVHIGQVGIEHVAAGMGLSVRALQRRLAQRGSSYQQRLDQVRWTLADQYLQDQGLGLADIALLLGYSEQSAFQRAYKQWTGKTPHQVRQQQQPLAKPA
jgi:AraC-like DNA-binding protein